MPLYAIITYDVPRMKFQYESKPTLLVWLPGDHLNNRPDIKTLNELEGEGERYYTLLAGSAAEPMLKILYKAFCTRKTAFGE